MLETKFSDSSERSFPNTVVSLLVQQQVYWKTGGMQLIAEKQEPAKCKAPPHTLRLAVECVTIE